MSRPLPRPAPRAYQALAVLLIALAVCLVAVAPALASSGVPERATRDAIKAATRDDRTRTPYRIAPVTTLEQKPDWVLPLSGYRLTASFGEYGLWSSAHTGLDFAAPSGTPIVSATAGTVVEAGYDGPYGYKTVVRTADGLEVWYCHQSAVSVSVGQQVAAGDPIGSVGTTGNVTGAHLHLEIRTGPDSPVDPYAVLQQHGLRP